MLLSTLQLLPALSLARAHQEVFNPEWLNRQSALGFDKVSDDSAPAHACGGVCLLTPEQMEGPFYLPYALDRANVTEGRPGIPVELTLTVYDVSASTSKECKPLKDAWVDIWAADYEGVYSGYGAEAEEGHPKRNWNEVLPIKNWVPRPPLPGPPGRGPPPDGPPGHAPPTNVSVPKYSRRSERQCCVQQAVYCKRLRRVATPLIQGFGAFLADISSGSHLFAWCPKDGY